MELVKKILVTFFAVLFLTTAVNATQEQIRVSIDEYVDQQVIVDPLKYVGASYGIWSDTTENQSVYTLTGYINVSNENLNGKTMSDIYVSFDFTTNITLPTLSSGRNGTFISSNPSSNNLILHIPELRTGEESVWTYSINTTSIRPPLNFTTAYSDTKVLAGDNLTLTDTLQNVFDNASYQTNTCIYNINITQNTIPVNFSGVFQDFFFVPATLAGTDATNVSFANANRRLAWDVNAGTCLNKGSATDINYDVTTPLNIPATTYYYFINTTLKYNLNQTISQLRVIDITAISEADLDFEKKIVAPSHATLYGSNVTWSVQGYFNTNTNISYNLTSVTFWVSKRNVNGSYTDPNTIDTDSINTSINLTTTTSPFVLVNSSSPWSSSLWLFNYSDVPSPIVWMDVNFTIQNDGIQLVDRSVTQNGNDIYIKELYLILGYWLEINKNITSIAQDQYHVEIDVNNKGNQVTPADTAVTIYDFVPGNFNITSPFVYATFNGTARSYAASPWYTVTSANTSINGTYNGTLFQWALIGNTALNTSFAPGPTMNENTTWSVEFNVTGLGDYTLMDVFITGLDPQQVDGAGSSKAVIVSEIMDRIKSTEGVFAVVASVLLLLGLLL